MLGEEAAKLRAVLELSHPLENGIVKDWDMMEELWKYGFFNKVLTTSLCLS
jgi:actin-related protein 2